MFFNHPSPTIMPDTQHDTSTAEAAAQHKHRNQLPVPDVEQMKVTMSETGIRFDFGPDGEFRVPSMLFHVLRDALVRYYASKNVERFIMIGQASRRQDSVPVLRDITLHEFYYDPLESFRSGVDFVNGQRYIVLHRAFAEGAFFRTRDPSERKSGRNGKSGHGKPAAPARDTSAERSGGTEAVAAQVPGGGDRAPQQEA